MKMVQDTAALMSTPDADIQWLTDLQAHITNKLREPYDSMGGPGGPGGGGMAGAPQDQMPPELAAMLGGQGPAAAAGGGIPMGGGPPPGPGPMPGPGAPNPDELRRIMGG